MLKNSFSARLLKKVQMQGGARCEVRGVLSPYVATPRERANPPQADRWAFFSSLLGSCLAFGPIPQEPPKWSPFDQGKALTPLVEFPSLQDQGLQIEPESGSEF